MLELSRSSTISTVAVSIETSVSITTVQGSPVTITQTATVIKRAAQSVPAYLSACSSSASRLSSACACYIGPTAAPVTVTATTYVRKTSVIVSLN